MLSDPRRCTIVRFGEALIEYTILIGILVLAAIVTIFAVRGWKSG
jgi:hypothetical protein